MVVVVGCISTTREISMYLVVVFTVNGIVFP